MFGWELTIIKEKYGTDIDTFSTVPYYEVRRTVPYSRTVLMLSSNVVGITLVVVVVVAVIDVVLKTVQMLGLRLLMF